MSLFFKGALWRHGPFLDLRLYRSQPTFLPRLRCDRPPNVPYRPFAQSTKPPKPPTKPASPPRSKAPVTTIKPPAKATQPYLSPTTSYTNLLSSRRSPTPLYQAPPTSTYPLACALIGGGAIAYGAYNFYDSFMTPHPGLAWFIPWLMVFVCAFMLGVGGWVIRNGARLVGRVSAVPMADGKGLMMRIESRGLLGRSVFERPVRDVRVGPGLTATRIEGLVGKQVGEMERYPATEEGRRAAQVAKRKAERQEYRESLKNPFTHMAAFFGSIFRRLSRGIRRVVGREGFAELYVRRKEGGRWQTWRMDVADGWCADEGMGLTRLLGR